MLDHNAEIVPIQRPYVRMHATTRVPTEWFSRVSILVRLDNASNQDMNHTLVMLMIVM